MGGFSVYRPSERATTIGGNLVRGFARFSSEEHRGPGIATRETGLYVPPVLYGVHDGAQLKNGTVHDQTVR